jgi:hypothetical protein
MTATVFEDRPMDQLATGRDGAATEWVWDGYLPRGDIALLTGLWTAGKTTLVAGLLHALGSGGTFLGRGVRAGTAVVVAEESAEHWEERVRAIPVGPHARLVSRPFVARPAPAQWDALVTWAEARRAAGGLDLFVVDPLASFLPGSSEADTGTLHAFLAPLRRLAAGGTAVLVLHHPAKALRAEGSLARGGGALLGYADVILELHHVARWRDGTRRRLTARSRRPGVVGRVVYEWAPGTADFRVVDDTAEARFRENWDGVRGLLAGRDVPATHRELLGDWPADEEAPSPSLLYDWLRRAAAAGLAVRTGGGTRTDPFRFALPRPPRSARGDILPELGPLRV